MMQSEYFITIIRQNVKYRETSDILKITKRNLLNQ